MNTSQLLQTLSELAGEVSLLYEPTNPFGQWLVTVKVGDCYLTGHSDDLDQAISQVIERVQNTAKEAA